jgi:hypothetical protein
MVSTVKVDVVAPRVATGTTTLGVSGDKLLVPSGVTMTNSGTLSGFPGFSKWTPVTASDATFALQSGTTKVILEVQASGGTAGNNSAYQGGNGGGGAYAKKLLDPMVHTDTLNITIGAVPATGGTAGTTTSAASAGGTAFTTVTCVGGQSGFVGGGGGHSNGGAGGTLPTTGDLNIAGGGGNNGSGDAGASSMFGIGGSRVIQASGNGDAAKGYGAGGGRGSGGSYTGGAGAPAIVMVWEYK